MNLNYDEVIRLDVHDYEQIMGKEIILSEWKHDIDTLKFEIKIQESLTEFFKQECFRLLRLCAENDINAIKTSEP